MAYWYAHTNSCSALAEWMTWVCKFQRAGEVRRGYIDDMLSGALIFPMTMPAALDADDQSLVNRWIMAANDGYQLTWVDMGASPVPDEMVKIDMDEMSRMAKELKALRDKGEAATSIGADGLKITGKKGSVAASVTKENPEAVERVVNIMRAYWLVDGVRQPAIRLSSQGWTWVDPNMFGLAMTTFKNMYGDEPLRLSLWESPSTKDRSWPLPWLAKVETYGQMAGYFLMSRMIQE